MEEGNQVLLKFSLGFLGLVRFFKIFFFFKRDVKLAC